MTHEEKKHLNELADGVKNGVSGIATSLNNLSEVIQNTLKITIRMVTMTYIRTILGISTDGNKIVNGMIALFLVYKDAKMPYIYFTEVLLSSLEDKTIDRNDVYKLVYHLKERDMYDTANYIVHELEKMDRKGRSTDKAPNLKGLNSLVGPQGTIL